MKDLRHLTIVILVGVALLAQLMNPSVVHADGETTPPPSKIPAETSTAEPTELSTKAVLTEAATAEIATSTPEPTELIETATEVAVTDLPATDPTVTETVSTMTVDPAESATPTPEAIETLEASPSDPESAETVATADPTATEEPTVAEVQQEIPEGTNIVVVDENGQTVPLVTQDAAEIVANSDPVWCPAGQAPTPGANGCTASYSTLGDLVNNEGAGISGDGTIWLTYGLVPDVAPVVIDGTVYSSWSNSALYLQGGWSGTYGAIDALGSSVFTVPLTIRNWRNDVAINLVDVQNGDLTVSNVNGNVSLNYVNSFNGPSSADGNVTVSDVSGNVIMNSVNAPKITVSNSTIRGGRIELNSVGADVAIRNVHVDSAAGSALGVSTYGAHNVSIDQSTFTSSTPNYSVTFPWGDGADIFPSGGNVSVTNSEFSGNDWGLWVVGGNQVSILNSLFNANNTDLAVSCALRALGLNFPDGIPVNLIVDQECTSTPVEPAGNLVEQSVVIPIEFDANQPQVEFDFACPAQKRLYRPKSYSIGLPNGDRVQIFCPVTGSARLRRVDNITLPAALPVGYTYASAFQLQILQPKLPIRIDPKTGDYIRETIPVITEGGSIQASFIAQHLQPGKNYSILYWDTDDNTWIPLKDFLLYPTNEPQIFELNPGDPTDQRKVRSGVNIVTRNGFSRVEVTTNFPGTFVLAQH